MDRVKAEKLATLFLAVFSAGLVVQLATAGLMAPGQWLGAAAAILGSITTAIVVRVWPQPAPAPATTRK